MILQKLIKKIKFQKMMKDKKSSEPKDEKGSQSISISKNLQDNLHHIQNILSSNADLIIRKFTFGKNKTEAFIINIDGMSAATAINENILGALMRYVGTSFDDKELSIDSIKDGALNMNDVSKISYMEEAIESILNGDTVLFLDEENMALQIGTSAWEHRNVEQSASERVVRGSHEAFTESIRVNTSLIRRRIKDPNLKIEQMKIGRRTRTTIGIIYIHNLANDKIVEEVKRRLKSIDTDAILESGYIEEFIEDAPLSIFPTIGNTEVPDKFSAKILEGRVGILVDGTPTALTVPFLFVECFQTAEDYYSGSFLSSQSRLLRFLALHVSVFLPGIYVALTTFHPNIIPKPLLLTILTTREHIPFPAFVEAFMLMIMFELIREAGIRMPLAVGQAVSIVGALILGDVAVNAGVVSPFMIIVVALTAIMGFLILPLTDPVTLLKFPILILASTFGLFGIIWSYIFIVIHLVSLRSFGSPYMSPLMPLTLKDLKDALIRVPWWLMKTRPQAISWRNSPMQEEDLKPEPPSKKTGGDNK